MSLFDKSKQFAIYVDNYFFHFFPMIDGMSTATYQAEYSERISRLFIFRFLWAYIMVWPLIVWAIWIGIISFLHFWYMLIMGKRLKSFWEKQERFMRHMTKWQAYFQLQTDARPKFIED